MVEAATVHMGFLEEGASDRELVGAATHEGGQEAGDMSARVAVANIEMKVEMVVVGSYGSNGWVESMVAVEAAKAKVSKPVVEGETPVEAEEVGKMESKAVAGEMVEVISKLAVEALSKRAATAEVAGVGKKLAEVAM